MSQIFVSHLQTSSLKTCVLFGGRGVPPSLPSRNSQSRRGGKHASSHGWNFRTCLEDQSMAWQGRQRFTLSRQGLLEGHCTWTEGFTAVGWIEVCEPSFQRWRRLYRISSVPSHAEVCVMGDTRGLRFGSPRKEWVESGKKERASFISKFFSLLI